MSGLFTTEVGSSMAVLQKSIPYDAENRRALPGVAPDTPDGWIIQDEAFAGQMALRDQLLSDQRDAVFGDIGGIGNAAVELLAAICAIVATRPGYVVAQDQVTRPDGVQVPLDGHPLITAARLVQEDLIILDKRGEEHVLAAGVLCFPASWRLAEKLGKPLIAIHDPVADYDASVAKRVQRLFDGVKPDRPLWRYNTLYYHDPALFQPRSNTEPKRIDDGSGRFLRSERQVVLRLPKSGAVVFAIHTYVKALR